MKVTVFCKVLEARNRSLSTEKIWKAERKQESAKRKEVSEVQFITVLWAELCLPQNSYIDVPKSSN